MVCPRCSGTMFKDRLEDLLDDSGEIYFYAYHCYSCGEILDDMILANRINRPKALSTRNRNLIHYN